jgi:hypothetical protein
MNKKNRGAACLHSIKEKIVKRRMRKELCRYRSPKEQDGEVLSIAADAEVLTTKGEFWKFFNADSCYKLFRKLYYLTVHLLIDNLVFYPYFS